MKDLLNKNANLIFALFIVAMPLTRSFFDLFNVEMNIVLQMAIWTVAFGMFLCFSVVFGLIRGNFNFKNLKNKVIDLFKNWYFIVVALMVLLIIASTIINASFNLELVLIFGYFLIFICFFKLTKPQRKLVINLLLGVIAVCCVMGFIDPLGKWIPSLITDDCGISLQFYNANYIAYIVAMLMVANFYFLNKEKKIWFIVFYSLTYAILGAHLFLNGSFFPIASTFIVEIFMLIFISIKNKKFQYKMLILILILIPLCLLSDLLVPLYGDGVRTCEYNFFVECVAVFDNIFKTDLLQKIFGIDQVIGSDGWNRSTLAKNAINSIISSPKNIIIGGGPGHFYTERPHNLALALAMDFGVLMPILFSLLIIKFFIDCIKSTFSDNLFVCVMVVSTFFICMFSAAHICYYMYVFLIFFAFAFKELKVKCQEKESLKIDNERGS